MGKQFASINAWTTYIYNHVSPYNPSGNRDCAQAIKGPAATLFTAGIKADTVSYSLLVLLGGSPHNFPYEHNIVKFNIIYE